jgi:hypothetical protein
MNELELKEIYRKLSNDNADLSNANAKKYIGSAINQIDNHKRVFLLLGGLSIAFYFFLSVGLYVLIQRPSTFNYITNQSNRRIILHQETPTEQKSKAKFIAKKISLLNPSVDSTKLADLISAAGYKHNIDPFFICSMIHHESNFNHKAKSNVGAMGLMQVMPKTAKYIGENANALYDPFDNIEAGTKYIKMLLIQFNFDHLAALVAYNAGPTIVSKHSIKTFKESYRYARNVNTTKTSWQKEYLKG